MADNDLLVDGVVLMSPFVLFMFNWTLSKIKSHYNRSQPSNNDPVRKEAEDVCINGVSSETLTARSSRSGTVEVHSRAASYSDYLAPRSNAASFQGSVATVTTRNRNPAKVKVHSRPASYSDSSASRLTAAPSQGGVSKVIIVRSRSISRSKKGSRLATASYQTEERLHGEFLCNNCNRLWMSNFSWINTAQKCQRCKIWVSPFKQRQAKCLENKSDSLMPHPKELCEKCTRLGRFCGSGSNYK